MTTPVEQLNFKPTTGGGITTITGSVKRAFGDWAGDVLNVKSFGAVGDGITDDTAAIQNAFNAAFGSYATPNGGQGATPGPKANIPVYFPGGTYLVTSSMTRNVIGTSSLGSSNTIILELSASASFITGDVVFVQDVGGTTNANGSWGIEVIDGTHIRLVTPTFNSTYTSGGTVTTPALRVHQVQGGHIFGEGRFSSVITCPSPNSIALCLNGWGYSRIESMSIQATASSGNGGGLGLDYNWARQSSDTVSSQSNTFSDLWLAGQRYACTVGWGGDMCSENTFINCFFSNGGTFPYGEGLSIRNQNSLANVVIGGNFQQCGYGIRIVGGAMSQISGVSFQNYAWFGGSSLCQPGIDVSIESNQGDGYSITGCRSESQNFVQGPSVLDIGINISGCCCTSPASVAGLGFFYSGGGRVNIDACTTQSGFYISGQNASVTIMNSSFPDTNYLSETISFTNYNYLEVHPQPVVTVSCSVYNVPSYVGSHKLIFSSSCNVTLQKNSDGTNRLAAGSYIDVQQTATTGSVTFSSTAGVTITARSSLRSLNGYGATGRLTCDGADAWTLSGDLV